MAKGEGLDPSELGQEVLGTGVRRLSELGAAPEPPSSGELTRAHLDWASRRWPDLTTRERTEKMKKLYDRNRGVSS